MRGLLAGIHLLKTSGDEQRTHPDYGLKEPLVVQVTAGGSGQPVVNLPVEFSFSKGKGRLQATTMTNSRGVAECHVEKVEGGTGAANTIAAKIDIESMAADADLYLITPPQVAFNYYIPTKSNTHIAVYVEDETASNVIKEALSSSGFRVVEESSVLKLAAEHEVRDDAEEEELLQAFSELQEGIGPQGFLFIVAGTVKVSGIEAMQTPSGTLHIARAPYAFKLIDVSAPGDEKSVVIVTGQGKEGYTDDEKEAARRACIAAAREAAAKLVDRLNKSFGWD